MSVRRSLIVLILLMLIVPVVLFSTQAARLRRAQPDTQLQFYTVGVGRVELPVTAIGRIEADSVVQLNFLTAGRVTAINVQPGDLVAAGDVLAQQASDNEQFAYSRSLLSVQLAELQKQDLLEPADDGAVRVAEANLAAAWGAYLGIQNAVSPSDIQAAELRYQQALKAQDDAVQARANADADQPEQAYQILDAQVGAASFNAEVARLQLESLRGGNSGALNAAYARVVQSQRELERVQAGPTQGQIDQADIAIQQAQAQVDQAAEALSEKSLVTPLDGLVTAVNIELGSLGTPALPAVEITDLSPLRVTVQVDEVDIRQIREGMLARIEVDALPGVAMTGVIEQIALVGTNNNGIISYDVQIRLDSVDPRVRPGMTAEASVVVEERAEVLVVPNEYIRLDRQRGTAFVNIVNAEGGLQEVEVTLGLQGRDTSEIVSGVAAGDVLAVDLGGDRLSFIGG